MAPRYYYDNDRPVLGEDVTEPGHSALHVVRRVVAFLLGLTALLLGVRFVLRLLGADGGFASLVYGISEPLIAPFRGILGDAVIAGAGVEMATILALVAYALLAWAISWLLSLAEPRRVHAY